MKNAEFRHLHKSGIGVEGPIFSLNTQMFPDLVQCGLWLCCCFRPHIIQRGLFRPGSVCSDLCVCVCVCVCVQLVGSWQCAQWSMSVEYGSTWMVTLVKPNLVLSSSVASVRTRWGSAPSPGGRGYWVNLICTFCKHRCVQTHPRRSGGPHHGRPFGKS